MPDDPVVNEDEDLAPAQTQGYKAPEKKTLEELKALDSNDESLKKWKESLLQGATTGNKDGKNVVILSLAMESEGRPDVVWDLSTPELIAQAKEKTIVVKEGAEYRIKIKFLVNRDVVAGLKYLQVVKRKGIRVDKTEEMIGSYGPRTEPYEKKFIAENAPSGMIARGHYTVRSRFIDDDAIVHLDFQWGLDIKKEWAE